MAHTPVTPTQFKTAKPQFATVPDLSVQAYLDMAGRVVDGGWPEADYPFATIAYTCHLMTLEGLGSDPASKAHASGAAEFQTIRSADLTLTRFQRQATGSSYSDWLASTPCGQQFAFMARAIRGGPRVVMAASVGASTSGCAKDALGWPGVFS